MPDDMELDFQSALRVAGIGIPEDRYAIMLDAYHQYRKLVEVLDQPTPYADEPAAAPHLAMSAIRSARPEGTTR